MFISKNSPVVIIIAEIRVWKELPIILKCSIWQPEVDKQYLPVVDQITNGKEYPFTHSNSVLMLQLPPPFKGSHYIQQLPRLHRWLVGPSWNLLILRWESQHVLIIKWVRQFSRRVPHSHFIVINYWMIPHITFGKIQSIIQLLVRLIWESIYNRIGTMPSITLLK